MGGGGGRGGEERKERRGGKGRRKGRRGESGAPDGPNLELVGNLSLSLAPSLPRSLVHMSYKARMRLEQARRTRREHAGREENTLRLRNAANTLFRSQHRQYQRWHGLVYTQKQIFLTCK